jgi:hypothetical protein
MCLCTAWCVETFKFVSGSFSSNECNRQCFADHDVEIVNFRCWRIFLMSCYITSGGLYLVA